MVDSLDHEFMCIASPLPHAPVTSNNVRIVTSIVIDLLHFHSHHDLRRRMKTAKIDWITFLHTVRQFPHLQQVVIQCERHVTGGSSHQKLVEFLAHLGEAWFGLDELLGLYYEEQSRSGYNWVQLRLDNLMDEIKQRVRLLLCRILHVLLT